MSVIDEVKQKIERIYRPKNVSCRSVLIHVNGVKEAVLETGYFSQVLNFGMLLKSIE